MHCWRAVAGLLEAFGVPGLQQLVFLRQQALECGKLGVLLGHQCGELFAADAWDRGMAWVFYLAALFVR